LPQRRVAEFPPCVPFSGALILGIHSSLGCQYPPPSDRLLLVVVDCVSIFPKISKLLSLPTFGFILVFRFTRTLRRRVLSPKLLRSSFRLTQRFCLRWAASVCPRVARFTLTCVFVRANKYLYSSASLSYSIGTPPVVRPQVVRERLHSFEGLRLLSPPITQCTVADCALGAVPF